MKIYRFFHLEICIEIIISIIVNTEENMQAEKLCLGVVLLNIMTDYELTGKVFIMMVRTSGPWEIWKEKDGHFDTHGEKKEYILSM